MYSRVLRTVSYKRQSWHPKEFSTVIRAHHGMPEKESSLLDLVRIADRFIDRPHADLGVGGIIPEKERGWIASEMKRISELLGVGDAGG